LGSMSATPPQATGTPPLAAPFGLQLAMNCAWSDLEAGDQSMDRWWWSSCCR